MTDTTFWTLVVIPVLIFLARTVDVSMGTVRILMVARGHRWGAPVIGFFEALLWLVAITQVIQHLDRPANYLAWATGFAAGTWLGMWVEERLALGLVSVRMITSGDASALVEALREADFGVTLVAARGLTGKVRLVFSIVRRRELERLLGIVGRAEPEAFVSVSDVRTAREGYLPAAGLLRAASRKGK